MEYNNIEKFIRKIKYEDRFFICSYDSYNCAKNGVNLDTIFPWVIETYFTFCIMTDRHSHITLEENLRKNINKVYQAIHEKSSHLKAELMHNIDYSKLTPIALEQFPHQQDVKLLLYRYYYLFEKTDLKTDFKNKFNVDYIEFVKFVFAVEIILHMDCVDRDKIKLIKLTIKHYKNVVDLISITKEDYIVKQNKFINNVDDYVLCYKPIFQYPFVILENGEYVYLTHLFGLSCTDSLWHRIKENNNLVSTKAGDIFANYILYLFKTMNKFDYLYSDFTYGKQNERSSDVNAFVNEYAIFCEVKSYIPAAKLRYNDSNSIEEAKDRIKRMYIQLYKSIRKYTEGIYKFKHEKIDKIELSKLFGLVIVFETPAFMDNLIKDEIIAENKIESEWADFIHSHISIVNYLEIEKIVFTNSNLVELLYAKSKDPIHYNDITLNGKETKFDNDVFDSFLNDLTDEVMTEFPKYITFI